MKRIFLIALSGLILLASPGVTATNPFAETTVIFSPTDAKAVSLAENTATSDAIAKAAASLAQASENYSKLIKQFVADPAKYGNEKGDYTEYVKLLQSLAKQLGELSDKLKKVSANAKTQETEKKTETKPANPPQTTAGTVKVGSSLNIRTSPWGKIIGSLSNNDKVTITGKSGDWYKISYNGKTAYIHANYVETADKKAGTTPVKSNQPAPASNTPVSKGGGLTSAPCSPMPSRASSEYGWRIHPTLHTRKFHDGIDLPIPSGTRLNALGNGVVVAAGFESGGGNYIKVRYDNGYESFYCHLKSSSAKKGARVSAGQEIARSDNTGQYTTGAHLHFALKKDGKSVNPRSAGIPLP
ncbi:MAG: M23 family metallopeptidase [Candidatus Riflebacteria bacterium]|nr:M23 family metallopeptidase [Candidatus Riflebacteria bacterium]